MGTGLPFDDVLVAAQAGAPWAFEVLYRDLSPSVTGYLRLHGAAEPDDLASETFLGVFQGLAGFRGDEQALRAWVFTIAHRRLIDDWRRRSRRPELAPDPGDLTDHVGATSRTTSWPAPAPRPCRPVRGTPAGSAGRPSAPHPRGPHRRPGGAGAGPVRRCGETAATARTADAAGPAGGELPRKSCRGCVPLRGRPAMTEVR